MWMALRAGDYKVPLSTVKASPKCSVARRNSKLNPRETKEQPVDEGKKDGAEHGRKAADDAKAGHDGRGQFQHQTIDQEVNNSKSKKDKRQENDFQKESDCRADQADDKGRN
jgi:hypothetical protein